MPEIISRYYEFLKWFMNKVSTYPRNQRYVFGKSMEDKSLSVLDKLIRAYYQKDKVEILKEINVELEIIRYYLRLSKDMGLLTIKQIDYKYYWKLF